MVQVTISNFWLDIDFDVEILKRMSVGALRGLQTYVIFLDFADRFGYFAKQKTPFLRYLRTNRNIKERVNAINFAEKLESVYFDRSCQNGALNI